MHTCNSCKTGNSDNACPHVSKVQAYLRCDMTNSDLVCSLPLSWDILRSVVPSTEECQIRLAFQYIYEFWGATWAIDPQSGEPQVLMIKHKQERSHKRRTSTQCVIAYCPHK